MKRNTSLAKLLPCHDEETSSAFLEQIGRRAGNLWRKLLKAGQRQPRALRLCESLNLGDRRFIAVVEYERLRFLLGGTSGSLVLLADLNPDAPEGAGDAPSGATPKDEATQ